MRTVFFIFLIYLGFKLFRYIFLVPFQIWIVIFLILFLIFIKIKENAKQDKQNRKLDPDKEIRLEDDVRREDGEGNDPETDKP